MVHAFRDATLLAALAASIAIHASVLVALGGIEHRPQAPNPLPQAEPRVLAVALVNPQEAMPSAPEPTPVETPAPKVPAPPPESPPIVPTATETVVAVAAGARDRAGLNKSHIDVSDQVPRARFGDALDRDVLADFPVEVDRAIVLPDRIDVVYPSAALAAGQEASVLAWAIIDAKGDVEETRIVEGPEEFAEAAKSALAATKFIPAHNKGHDIRFYVALEFVFRIDTGDNGIATAGAAAAQR
jgi:TonB family protein